MISLKINSLNKINKFIFILLFIHFFSVNALSDESKIFKAIEQEWNQTQTLSGQFRQKINGDKFISGDFFIDKPYKSNFTYRDQNQKIITSKFFVNFVDEEGVLFDRYPIINQPIYKLFSKSVSFANIFEIKSIAQNQAEVIIKLATNYNKGANETEIILTFHSNNYLLKKWEIINALGQSTYLEFTNIIKNISIDQNLFIFREKIKY